MNQLVQKFGLYYWAGYGYTSPRMIWTYIVYEHHKSGIFLGNELVAITPIL